MKLYPLIGLYVIEHSNIIIITANSVLYVHLKGIVSFQIFQTNIVLIL